MIWIIQSFILEIATDKKMILHAISAFGASRLRFLSGTLSMKCHIFAISGLGSIKRTSQSALAEYWVDHIFYVFFWANFNEIQWYFSLEMTFNFALYDFFLNHLQYFTQYIYIYMKTALEIGFGFFLLIFILKLLTMLPSVADS